MTKIKRAMGLVVLATWASVLVGCSSPPAEQSKPVQAGDGSQKPAGATSSSVGGASGSATATKTQSN